MPSLQDIEKFKAQLNELGSEPEILAERGEAIEDLPPPEQGLAPDVSDLFAGVKPAAAEAEPEAQGPPETGAEEPDFSSLFSLEAAEGPEAAPGEEVAEAAPMEEAPKPPPAEAAPSRMAEAAPSATLETALPAEEVPIELTDFILPADFGVHEEGAGEPSAVEQPAIETPVVEQPLVEPSAVEPPAGPEAGLEAGGVFGEELPPPEEAFETPLEPFSFVEEAPSAPSAPAGEPAEAPPEPFPEALAPEMFEALEAPPIEAPPTEAYEAPPIEAFEAPPTEAPSAEAPPTEAPPEAEPGVEGIEGLSELPEEFAAPGFFEEQPVEAPAPPTPGKAQRPEAEQAAAEAPAAQPPPKAAPVREFALSERRFAMLKRTLARLPRNLKMLVEELIGVRELSGPDLAALTELLATGAAPARIAEEVSRITGQRIRLPRDYERLTGLAFEEERLRFGYALRENIGPILRTAVFSLLFLALLSYLGYRFLYRPLYANVQYRRGYELIQKELYRPAEEHFARANAIIRFKGWYLRYADAYAAKRQYPLAAQKYELLLKHFPLDKQGSLAYAGLLTYSTFGFERAEQVLNRYLEAKNFKDPDILLARGDNFLEWAAEEAKHYEQARLQYATILDHYGEQDPVLLRMMRYFIRVKPPRFKETRDLYRLLESKKSVKAPASLFASVYAELGGFWLDQAEQGNPSGLEDVKDVLFKAMRRQKLLPEVHYQLARYYRYLNDDVEEEKALKNAIVLLEQAQPPSRPRQIALIDSHIRLAQSYWRRKEYLQSERSYKKAIDLIEQRQRERILGYSAPFGLAYLGLGDIYYYISRDLRAARTMYEKAEANAYHSPELDYRIGYLDYFQGSYDEALRRFTRVVDERGPNENALYALANALYYQGFYSSAQGYYLRLLDLLEIRRSRIPLLSVAENPEHRNLVEFLMKVYNNLGVTYRRLSERSRSPDLQAKALVNLTYSSEYFDLLTRDPDTAERGITRNLAYLNQRAMLYPAQPFEPQLYDRIPLDLEAAVF